MTTTSITFDETQWQYGLDKANAANAAANAAANTQARLMNARVNFGMPPAEQTAFTPSVFTPLTLEEFVQAHIDSTGLHYVQKQVDEHLSIIATQPPANIARFIKVIGQPEPIQAQITATIDALP